MISDNLATQFIDHGFERIIMSSSSLETFWIGLLCDCVYHV